MNMKTKIISIAAMLLFAASATSAFATDYYLVGDCNTWTNKLEDYKFELSNGVYTITKSISGDFKIKDDAEKWYGTDLGDNNGYWFTFTNRSVNLVSPGNHNLHVESGTTYTFTITFEEEQMKLYVSGFNTPCIAGSFTNNWTKVQMTPNNDGTYTYGPVQLYTNDIFKITDSPNNDAKWYSGITENNNDYWIQNNTCSNISLVEAAGQGHNLNIRADGTYTIIFTRDGKLSVDGFFTKIYDANSIPQSSDPIDVELPNLTLYKDGDWNTLCLPFGVNNFAGTPLENAEVRELSSSSLVEGTLELNFSDPVSSISAGVPYIAKWTSGSTITGPRFFGVAISSTLNPAQSSGVTFKGTFNEISFTEENKNILFLGTGSTLYYPLDGASIGAFRAYFELSSGLQVKAFNLNFGDEETSIKQINSTESATDTYYTIDGRHLNDKPATAGLYIINGKKVVIK